MYKNTVFSSALLVVVLLGQGYKQNVNVPIDPNPGIHRIQKFGKALEAISNEAIKTEEELADAGEFEAGFDEAGLRKALLEGKSDIHAFNDSIKDLTDADLSTVRAKALAISKTATTFISNLETNGGLHMKNPQSQKKAQLIITSITITTGFECIGGQSGNFSI